MTPKWLEIRDRGTTIPALGLWISAADGWLAERAGYGEVSCLLLINLAKHVCQHDPWNWDPYQGRTLHIAHVWLQEHWATVQDGAVIDVEYILGETPAPKVSDRPAPSPTEA